MVDFLRMKRFTPNSPFDVDPNSAFQQALNISTPDLDDPTQNPQESQFQNESLKRFLEMAVPQRTEPNLISKIGGVMMSATRSPEDVDRAVNSRYYGKVSDYQNQVNNMLKGAQIESQQNNYRSLGDYRQGQLGVANRRAATGETNAATGQQRAATGQFSAENRAKTNDERLKIANAKLVLDRENARYKGATLKAVPGGNMMWFFPDGRKLDSQVGSGLLTDAAQADLEYEYKSRLQEDAQAATVENIGQRAVAEAGVKASPSYSDLHPNAKPQTEYERTRAIRNRADSLLRAAPHYSDFIKVDGDRVTVNPNTPEDLKTIINKYLDGQTDYAPAGIGPRDAPQSNRFSPAPQQAAPQAATPVQQPASAPEQVTGEEQFEGLQLNPAQTGFTPEPRRNVAPSPVVQPSPQAPPVPQVPQRVPAVRAATSARGTGYNQPPGVPMTGAGNAPNQTPIGGGDPNEKVTVHKGNETAQVSRRNLDKAYRDGWKQ